MKHFLTLLPALFLAPLAKLHAAELRPAAIFSDHMVLQRQVEVPVWGTTEPGGKVTVRFMSQTKTVTADDGGKWMTKLDKMEAVAEPQEMSVADPDRTITFKDILVGDVWLGSGQSNMEFGWTFSDEFKVRRAAKEGTPEKAKDPGYMVGCVDDETMEVLRRALGNPMIRISAKTRDHLNTPDTGWSRVTEENVKTLPALAGCIAVYLQEEIEVPVGIIVRAVSSTHTVRWITEEGFLGNPLVKKQIAANKAIGGPVVPYALKGFLWDQGEQGIGYSQQGADWTAAMHALVTSWRAAWGQGDLPWSATDHYPDGLEAQLHEAGLGAFKIAKTDGLSGALHPLNKWQYAQKHVDNILPMAYGQASPSRKQAVGPVPGQSRSR